MGLFSFVRDERFVAAGFGIATVSCIVAMRIILLHSRDKAEIQPAQPKTQYITQATEDSLKSSTLNTLLQHYNFAIRDTAVRIVASRAVNDNSTIHDLLWGITREDYDERMRSLRALTFALDDSSYRNSFAVALNTPKGYSAIVRSLELSLGDVEHETLDNPYHDEYPLRDIGEQRCLLIVTVLIHHHGVEKLVDAKFVEKWLAKQPWGDIAEERRANFAHYLDRKKNTISDICIHLQASRVGRKALARAKLATKLRKSKESKNIKVVLEFSMGSEAGGRLTPSQMELIPRVNDQSVEEQRLRRRHREAMVLNDGTHSLGRGDIIEREHDSNN
ncbi:putative cytoskeleton-associated protein [Rosellinia necatrix]|uniref:Putative cytoskeleton-associated protein n=1 Tax=Rosellinia necatrix TaxID=77044 RepID=A0A1W2TDZ2_ROSNE|nr:putative cytoskeleton-associated protein [Rosellinia necatrix]